MTYSTAAIRAWRSVTAAATARHPDLPMSEHSRLQGYQLSAYASGRDGVAHRQHYSSPMDTGLL